MAYPVLARAFYSQAQQPGPWGPSSTSVIASTTEHKHELQASYINIQTSILMISILCR